MGDKHGPNRLDRYKQTHETVMEQFRAQGFVLDDDLRFVPAGDEEITIIGFIDCLGGIRIKVTKVLRVIEGDGPSALVQTIRYGYNAFIDGIANILRYCSPHEDHNRFHHVHRYDPFDGEKGGEAEQTSETGWPTLGEVIEEVRGWYHDNAQAVEALRQRYANDE